MQSVLGLLLCAVDMRLGVGKCLSLAKTISLSLDAFSSRFLFIQRIGRDLGGISHRSIFTHLTYLLTPFLLFFSRIFKTSTFFY